ncbi:MAG: glutamine-hydrolyzing carbamoyl-phosphate synthase small subunit [Acidimicrobiales bacterium]|nr:glutamine-hydrolyzing carbamoyl-phosphate synthase small subunit [Acidimicrobiales bacterium]MDP7507962.1 glutamine-hydrolyzing carbamoyl-phosphate synthase small subunit [Acidimicrobiales bacterium]MEE1563367.1 glutamine-hydrolyzing carbamoyl-phosphate synthase small subunit [Acidimicrobiales bacterium]
MTEPVHGIAEALLVLADGTVFEGEAIGAPPPDGVQTGEVVFNTVLCGYQEVITDPSYAGQVIAFTYPHIGNYGVNPDDYESRRPFCSGVIVRDLARRHSNWRATGNLDDLLRGHGIPGIGGIDTRRLTRHLRDLGAMPGAFGTADEATLRAAAVGAVGTDGIDLVATVTCEEPHSVQSTGGGRRIVAYDFGIKATILRHLSGLGEVTVVPASTSADEVLALGPDGVFLSNGPGDPEPLTGIRDQITDLLGRVPVFGICLGHQLLAGALGAETFKLPFGHHGGNHPVRNLATGSVEITSQNHNYCVAEGSIPSADLTHVNLNDGTVEGLRCRDVPAFSVQYHPEAGPGPHDSRYLFAEFEQLMAAAGGRAGA